jgi:hypothetical protein
MRPSVEKILLISERLYFQRKNNFLIAKVPLLLLNVPGTKCPWYPLLESRTQARSINFKWLPLRAFCFLNKSIIIKEQIR